MKNPEVKEKILKQLKTALAKDGNVVQSKKSKNQFIVTLEDGFHVIVKRKKNKVDDKVLFVPVTLLAPHMKLIWIKLIR